MHPVLKQISDIGIVPVIAIDDAEKAVPLAKALVAGGLRSPSAPPPARRLSVPSAGRSRKCW